MNRYALLPGCSTDGPTGNFEVVYACDALLPFVAFGSHS